jgi:hypothetical protein
MIWMKRHYETTWANTTLLDDFEKLFMALKGPASMLMIEEEHAPLDSTVWMRLPNSALAAAFPGFEEASSAGLPKKAILLAGHTGEFEKLFNYGSS